MNLMKSFQAACVILCITCVLAVSLHHGQARADVICETPTPIPSSTPTPMPSANILLNAEWVKRADQFQATFQLNESISQAFKAYAVIVLPKGKMLNALTMDKPPKPVVDNHPRLDAPFTYPLINRNVSKGAPLGNYEVMVGFFNPQQRVTASTDAFLLVRRAFYMVTDLPTPTPTATPIPDLSGEWSGTWVVALPTPCAIINHGGWTATIYMEADGRITGEYHTTGSSEINGDVAGYYDGTTATWVVCDPTHGAVSYSGAVTMSGTIVLGTFWDGPQCGGGRTSGTFEGNKD